jgi:hypothetical protein
MIQKSRPYLVHLNLRSCLKLTSSAFVTVSGCHNIQDLNLSNCINLTVHYSYYFVVFIDYFVEKIFILKI